MAKKTSTGGMMSGMPKMAGMSMSKVKMLSAKEMGVQTGTKKRSAKKKS